MLGDIGKSYVETNHGTEVIVRQYESFFSTIVWCTSFGSSCVHRMSEAATLLCVEKPICALI